MSGLKTVHDMMDGIAWNWQKKVHPLFMVNYNLSSIIMPTKLLSHGKMLSAQELGRVFIIYTRIFTG